jgi:flavin reductase (DIM6/NTAB) family NADH-FMN oxidoreductase RutF
MPVDRRQFRNTLGSFVSGVTVLAVRDAHGLRAMTASAFCSLSLDPPLVLACVGRDANLHDHLAPGATMSVSLLAADQAPISNFYANYGADRAEAAWIDRGAGAPTVAGAVGWITGRVHALQDGGDHSIVVIAVDDLGAEPGDALAYFRGSYGRFVAGG